MNKKQRLALASSLGTGVTLIFVFIYGVTNWITSLHHLRVPLHSQLELQLPLMPEFSFIYLSLFPMFWLSPFVLKTKEDLKSLATNISFCIFLAAPIFLLVPAELKYPQVSISKFNDIHTFTKIISLDYNLFPSLHVAFASCIAYQFGKNTTLSWRVFLSFWVALVALSTVLTHRHHLIDIPGGFLLAWGVVFLGKRRASLKLKIPNRI